MAWPPQDNTSGGDEVKSATVPNLRRCRSSSGYNFALSETSPSDHAIAATAGSSHVLSRCAGCRDLSLSCRKPDRGGRSWTILEAPLAGYPGNRMRSSRRRAETVISFLIRREMPLLLNDRFAPIVLQKLNCFRMNCQIALCNDGLMPILAMIADGRCAHLGYVLGYLRHGSLGRPAPGGPTDRAAGPPVRWRASGRWRRAVRASPNDLNADACRLRGDVPDAGVAAVCAQPSQRGSVIAAISETACFPHAMRPIAL